MRFPYKTAWPSPTWLLHTPGWALAQRAPVDRIWLTPLAGDFLLEVGMWRGKVEISLPTPVVRIWLTPLAGRFPARSGHVVRKSEISLPNCVAEGHLACLAEPDLAVAYSRLGTCPKSPSSENMAHAPGGAISCQMWARGKEK